MPRKPRTPKPNAAAPDLDQALALLDAWEVAPVASHRQLNERYARVLAHVKASLADRPRALDCLHIPLA